MHGCVHCAIDSLVYEDPENYEPPVPRDSVMWETLNDLGATYLDSGEVPGCGLCVEIRNRSGFAAFPGWECELADCLHCSICNLCHRTGVVCGDCGLCIEHQSLASSPLSACAGMSWDPTLRGQREYFRHRLLDPSTGLWRRQ